MRQRQRRLDSVEIISHLILTIFAIITLYPFWYVLVASVIPYNEYAEKVLLLYPNRIILDAYKKILSSNNIRRSFNISVWTTILGTIISVFITSIGAYVLSRKELPGRRLLFSIVIITMLFSGGVLPLYLCLVKYKMINTLWVYMLPGLINTFYLIIMRTNFSEIPEDLLMSSRIDGCSEVGILFRIIYPISLPIFSTIVLFRAVDMWNQMSTGLFFITSAKLYNLQIVLYNIIRSSDPSGQGSVGNIDDMLVEEQLKFSAIIVSTLPIIVVYPFLQKYFIKGVLVGAIKS
jgi:putative aldouronate transport system permease protein